MGVFEETEDMENSDSDVSAGDSHVGEKEFAAEMNGNVEENEVGPKTEALTEIETEGENSANNESGEEYVANEEEMKDDEETLDVEEELDDVDHEAELDDLQNEAEMSIEELKKLYGVDRTVTEE